MIPSPKQLGFPPKFSRWHHYQPALINECVGELTKHRFHAVSVPTGGGKSPAYVAMWRLLMENGTLMENANKLVVLTQTKTLQDQSLRDFASMGMVDVRGRANYQCVEYKSKKHAWNCDEAAAGCGAGEECEARMAYAAALYGDAVVTNYPYWLTIGRYGGGLGTARMPTAVPVNAPGLLVLDEAHLAGGALSRFMHIDFTKERLDRVKAKGLVPGWEAEWGWTEWKGWGKELSKWCGEQLEDPDHDVRQRKRLELLQADANELRLMKAEEWVHELLVERKGERAKGVAFDVVWPGRYAEKYLFRNVKKVLFVSATLRPRTVSALGIKEKMFSHKEYPTVFDQRRCPVWWVKTVRLNSYTQVDELRTWAGRNAQIVSKWEGYRGIVHTHSYFRAKFQYENSPDKDRLVLHRQGESGEEALVRWREKGKEAVLISPSMEVGYDFGDDMCRFQIIGKVPYPGEMSTLVGKARRKADKRYYDAETADTLGQMKGRLMRREQDWGATYVTDDMIGQFQKNNKDLLCADWDAKWCGSWIPGPGDVHKGD